MVPTTQEIARQLAVMVELYPEKTTSEIAQELAYSPLFIINAMSEAENMGLLRTDRDNDKLIPVEKIRYADGLGFGEDITRIQDEILRVVTDANRKEEDVEIGNFYHSWLRGVLPSAIDMAIHILKEIGFIVTYKLTDPYDKKSEYEFLTLTLNNGEEWGLKQFKPKSEKSKKK